MASIQKRTPALRRAPRGASERRRTAKVADMTKKELQDMIERSIDRKMAQWLDPDAGLELRPVVAN
jgi:hypothetical protein